jgi:CobQ-like glutamine amidotransferase family enzyme
MSGIRIVRLYPADLDFGGDRGNVEALLLRAQRAGLEVEFATHGVGDGEIGRADLLVLGTGPASVLDRVLADARQHRDELASLIAGGTPVLAIGAGAEILGGSIATLDGTVHEGLGVIPLSAVRNRERRIGYVIADSPAGELVGFEDHASRWTAGGGAEAFGSVRVGQGIVQFGDRWSVGFRSGDVFALQLQGPLLPLNPAMTDLLLSLAAAHAGTPYGGPAEHAAVDDYADGVRAQFQEYVKGKELHYIRV